MAGLGITLDVLARRRGNGGDDLLMQFRPRLSKAGSSSDVKETTALGAAICRRTGRRFFQ